MHFFKKQMEERRVMYREEIASCFLNIHSLLILSSYLPGTEMSWLELW